MEDVYIAAPRPLRLFTPLVVGHRPRPRIIAAPVEAFARFSLSDDPSDDLHPTVSSPQSNPSPNPSPTVHSDLTTGHVVYESSNSRLGLPDETLEEFFSILRPPIVSPPLRVPRRHHPTNNAAWVYERPHPYRMGRKSTSSSTTTTATDETDRKSRRGIGRLSRDRSETDTPLTTAIEDLPHDWLNFELGSPISRTHTRNPLPRHPSYETLTSNLLLSTQFSPPLRPSNNPVEIPPLKADFTEETASEGILETSSFHP